MADFSDHTSSYINSGADSAQVAHLSGADWGRTAQESGVPSLSLRGGYRGGPFFPGSLWSSLSGTFFIPGTPPRTLLGTCCPCPLQVALGPSSSTATRCCHRWRSPTNGSYSTNRLPRWTRWVQISRRSRTPWWIGLRATKPQQPP